MQSNKNYIKLFIIIGLVLFCCNSCENTGLIYDVNHKGTLYFESKSLPIKSFVFELGNTIEYTIPVKLMGTPLKKDRAFEIYFDTDTALTNNGLTVGGVHYDIVKAREDIDFTFESLVIPADSVTGYIRFTLNRTDYIKDRYALIYPRIKENDSFIPMFGNGYSFLISDGEVPMPDWWNNGVTGSSRVDGWQMYIGKFYPEKFKRMLQLYWDMEQLSPIFYEEALESYGKYFDNPSLKAGFYQKDYPAVWAKYVLIPLYEYYKENPIPGDALFSESGNQGEYWRDPVALYR